MKNITRTFRLFLLLVFSFCWGLPFPEAWGAEGANRLRQDTSADSLKIQGPSVPEGKEVTLESGTSIMFELSEDVNSDRAEPGDKVKFQVVAEVKAAGEVVINHGARAEGKVVDVTPSKGNGKPGEIVIKPTIAYAVGGSRVMVTPERMEDRGEDKDWVRWVAWLSCFFVIGPFGLLLLLIHGGEGHINAGQTVRATVVQDTEIEVD